MIWKSPQNEWMNKAIWVTFCFVTCLYAIGAIFTPPAMFSDSGFGFAVWRSMQLGGQFNYLLQADSGNIKLDTSAFMTTWTPGQYLIPGLLTECGLSLGHSLTLITLLSSYFGLLGWYYVYLSLGFTNWIGSLSCLIILLNRFFVLPFGIYNGGEVLLFGGAPYLILTCFWALKAPRFRFIFLVPMFLFCFFLKNSALIVALAICTYLVLMTLFLSKGSKRVFELLRWPSVLITTFAITYFGFTSHGWTAVNFQPHIVDHALGTGFFAITAPLMSMISLDDALNFVLSKPDKVIFENWNYSLPFILPMAFVACVAYIWAGLANTGTKYRVILFSFLGVYIFLFATLNVLGSAVSSEKEARHFRTAGLLLLPGLLVAATTIPWRPVAYSAVLCIVLLPSLYGLSSYSNKWLYLRKSGSVGTQGFTNSILDKEALRWLIQTNSAFPTRTALIYLTSPEMAMEVSNQRVILSHADFEDNKTLTVRSYNGIVDNLFVLLPDRFVSSGKANIILSSFRDYEQWDSVCVGTFRVFTGRPRLKSLVIDFVED